MSLKNLIVFLSTLAVLAYGSQELKEKLEKAKSVVAKTIKNIADEWEIAKYPNFLKSCFMHKPGWDQLKWKYMAKILASEMHQQPEQFVMSFSGR